MPASPTSPTFNPRVLETRFRLAEIRGEVARNPALQDFYEKLRTDIQPLLAHNTGALVIIGLGSLHEVTEEEFNTEEHQKWRRVEQTPPPSFSYLSKN